MSHYDHFFSQRGGALSDSQFGPIYQARHHLQRGRGFSTLFTTLARLIGPYLAKGARALGVEGARAGAEILGNLGSQPIGNLLREQRDKSINNLGAKAGAKLRQVQERLMTSEGIKAPRGSVSQFIEGLGKLKKTSRRRRRKVKRLGTKRRKARKPAKRRSTKRRPAKRRRRTKSKKSSFLKQYL